MACQSASVDYHKKKKKLQTVVLTVSRNLEELSNCQSYFHSFYCFYFKGRNKTLCDRTVQWPSEYKGLDYSFYLLMTLLSLLVHKKKISLWQLLNLSVFISFQETKGVEAPLVCQRCSLEKNLLILFWSAGCLALVYWIFARFEADWLVKDKVC